jgi:hypothetical protein
VKPVTPPSQPGAIHQVFGRQLEAEPAIDLERQLPNIRWLVGKSCDLGAPLGLLESNVRAVADSDRMTQFADKLAALRPYAAFQMAEVAVPKELFEKILCLIDGLRPPPAPASGRVGWMPQDHGRSVSG